MYCYVTILFFIVENIILLLIFFNNLRLPCQKSHCRTRCSLMPSFQEGVIGLTYAMTVF